MVLGNKKKRASSWLILAGKYREANVAILSPQHKPELNGASVSRLCAAAQLRPPLPHRYSICAENIKARSFKYEGRYCCLAEQSLSDTLFNNRIRSRLRPNTGDHNAFMAAIVNSIFKFHPTLALAYWSVIWSAELLTRPRVVTACRRYVLFFSLSLSPAAAISGCITLTLNLGNNNSVGGKKKKKNCLAVERHQTPPASFI